MWDSGEVRVSTGSPEVYPEALEGLLGRWELGFPGGSAGEESACNGGDLGPIPGLGRSPGEVKGYPLQYSGLENSKECIVHGVAKSQTQLSDFHSLKVLLLSMLLRLYPSVYLPIPYYVHSTCCTRHYTSLQLHIKFHHTGNLKPATVGVFPL